MKKSLFLLVISLLVIACCPSCGYERIDAGHVGIKVNLYGSEKGVDDVTEVTGAQWYNPFRTQIFEFPTYVQNEIWTKDDREGSEDDESFKLTTKDGMTVTLDVSLNYLVPSNRAVQIFTKYRKPLKEVGATVLRNYTRDGYNTACSYYTAEEMFTNRREFEKVADSLVIKILEKEGFQVEKVVLVSNVGLPDAISKSIEAKVKAKQTALMKESELQSTTADAEKQIEEARGKAESMKIQADAEKYSYEQKQKALTSLLIQQQFIEKWDGKLPIYGETPKIFKSIN